MPKKLNYHIENPERFDNYKLYLAKLQDEFQLSNQDMKDWIFTFEKLSKWNNNSNFHRFRKLWKKYLEDNDIIMNTGKNWFLMNKYKNSKVYDYDMKLIKEIQDMYSTTEISMKELGEIFNLTFSQLNAILYSTEKSSKRNYFQKRNKKVLDLLKKNNNDYSKVATLTGLSYSQVYRIYNVSQFHKKAIPSYPKKVVEEFNKGKALKQIVDEHKIKTTNIYYQVRAYCTMKDGRLYIK